MAKVWVVEAYSSLSDTTTEGVFSSDAKARTYVEATGAVRLMQTNGTLTDSWRGDHEDYDITEYELDAQ